MDKTTFEHYGTKQFLRHLPHIKPDVFEAIVVVSDLRGFSTWCEVVGGERRTADVIKNFYHWLSLRYFIDCDWIKPTGDGLIFVYHLPDGDAADAKKRGEAVREKFRAILHSCMQAVEDYPNEFLKHMEEEYDLVLPVPAGIGFGVSRGTVVRLARVRQNGEIGVYDYSGRPINVAARLNDYARPRGVWVDGRDGKPKLADFGVYRDRFIEDRVMLRGIAEQELAVAFKSDHVDITRLPYAKMALPKDTHQQPATLKKSRTQPRVLKSTKGQRKK